MVICLIAIIISYNFALADKKNKDQANFWTTDVFFVEGFCCGLDLSGKLIQPSQFCAVKPGNLGQYTYYSVL